VLFSNCHFAAGPWDCCVGHDDGDPDRTCAPKYDARTGEKLNFSSLVKFPRGYVDKLKSCLHASKGFKFDVGHVKLLSGYRGNSWTIVVQPLEGLRKRYDGDPKLWEDAWDRLRYFGKELLDKQSLDALINFKNCVINL
jgi:hypothetical protein